MNLYKEFLEEFLKLGYSKDEAAELAHLAALILSDEATASLIDEFI